MILVGVSVLVSACGSGSPEQNAARTDLEISADRARYRAGHPLTLTVRNRRADTVSFNPCTRTLEAQRDGKWVAVPEPARICTMEAWMVSPGGTREGPTDIPADLRAGRYRVVLGFNPGSPAPSDEKLEARTAPFTVDR